MYNFSIEMLEEYLDQYDAVEDEYPELLYDSCDDLDTIYKYMCSLLDTYLTKDSSVSWKLTNALVDHFQVSGSDDMSSNFMESPIYENLRLLSDYYLAGFIEAKYIQTNIDEQKRYLAEQIQYVETFVEKLPLPLQKELREIPRLLYGAKGRYHLDCNENLSIKEMAYLSLTNEKSIYNAIAAKNLEVDKNKKISNISAQKWLQKKIKPSLWKNFVEPNINQEGFFCNILNSMKGKPPILPIKKITYYLVPVSKGNDIFDGSLMRNGQFTVGEKGNETKYSSFEEALNALVQMETPYWRRPNEKGSWGIVKGKYWTRKSNIELNLKEEK